MQDEKAKKRALRIIGALEKAGGQSRAEPMKDNVLLSFGAGRTIQCPTRLLQHMVATGWLDKISSEKTGTVHIRLTEDGRSWRNRCRRGVVGQFEIRARFL